MPAVSHREKSISYRVTLFVLIIRNGSIKIEKKKTARARSLVVDRCSVAGTSTEKGASSSPLCPPPPPPPQRGLLEYAAEMEREHGEGAEKQRRGERKIRK